MQVQHWVPIRIAGLGVPDIGAVGQPDPKISPHHRPPSSRRPSTEPASHTGLQARGDTSDRIHQQSRSGHCLHTPLSTLAQTDGPVLVPGR
jgi:hypothetical protein